MSARRPAVGRGNCDCSNISIMQLFHELKQQFPAVPDEIVNSCIQDNCHDKPACWRRLQREAEALPRALAYPPSLMAPNHRTAADGSDHNKINDSVHRIDHTRITDSVHRIDHTRMTDSVHRIDHTRMTDSVHRIDHETVKSDSVHRLDHETVKPSAFSPKSSKRSVNTPNSNCVNAILSPSPAPTSIGNRTPPSADPPKVPRPCVISAETSSKPPMSPSSSRRFLKNSPIKPKNLDSKLTKLPEETSPTLNSHATSVSSDITNFGAIKKSTAIRPASLDLQKSDNSVSGSVNLSVNVNCSLDLVTTPTRHSAVLQVTPEPVWCQENIKSPRSYTSVNLTLRTPTSEPQPPIDICSANSSLTYSSSSFDSRQGLQSRLQITVGPGGVGSVSTVRTRPRSSYHPDGASMEPTPVSGSMPNLATISGTTNHVILVSRQLERKEQLRKELETGKERLYSIKKEVLALRLENTPEYRERLRKEIRHLQSQCDRLTHEVDRHSESGVPLGETSEEFYRHIYTGQRGSLRSRDVRGRSPMTSREGDEVSRWPCHICTFRNHPLMDKCEQCEMPRILLVSAGPGENIHIRFIPGNSTRVIHSWVV